MDFASVAGLTIPAGSVNKISIGGVVVWVKSTPKYKILKDGKQVASVTMSEFVKAVQSGAAQENWGIGAQIVVPCKDTEKSRSNYYDLPFNFGTFTAYGEGKLCLQAHYAVPHSATVFCPQKKAVDLSYDCWGNSYVYKWLNGYGSTGTEYGASSYTYTQCRGFLSCIPQDFIDNIQETTKSNVSCKFFLPTTVDYNATITDSVTVSAWEYWINKIGKKAQQLNTIDNKRITYLLTDKTKAVVIATNTYYAANNGYYYVYLFSSNGNFSSGVTYQAQYYYLPACVIG